MTKKPSKFEQSQRNSGKLVEATHFEWYWFALCYRKKVPPSLVAIATIKQTCVCKHCDHKHTKDVLVTIHGDHDWAVRVAGTLFYVGRPGVKPEQIEKIEVTTPDCKWTPIYRGKDGGEPEAGITMRRGTIRELVDVGFLHTSGGKEKAA